MADNKIKVGYELNDNGSVDKLKKKTDAAAKSTDNLTKSKENYNRREKGAAGITSNSTKAFSKMQQGIEGGLVPAYATLAANVFAVTAAFGVLQRAAAATQLEAGLMAVGRAGGANLKLVAQGLREVTDLAVSTQAAMEATAIATSAGFSEQQIKSLGEVAKGASLALGRDMTDALTRLTRGTSKLEPELLDELGIFVKIEDATNKYAAALGKSRDELTQFERRQAFANAAIEEGNKKFGLLNMLVEANPYDKLAASFNDLTRTGLEFANKILGPVASFLADSPAALLGIFGAFASGIVAQIVPSLEKSALAAKASAQISAQQASKATKVISDEYKNASASVQASWKTVPKSVAKLEQKFKDGTMSAKELKQAIRALSQSETLRANAKKSQDAELAKNRAQELADVRALKAAMLDLQSAESKKFTASAAGARASQSATASGLTARGLTEMGNATSLMQKFSIATRYSGLQMQNLGRTTGVWSLMTVGAKGAAGAVRLFGSALLSAIPIIGQVIMIGSLLWEGYKWIFDKKPSMLDKELEKAQERYAEFPNIISQMAIAYNAAATRTEAFAAAMKPTVGLLKQTSDQITAIINAEQNAKVAEYAKAQGEAVAMQAKFNDLKRKEAQLRKEGRIYEQTDDMTGNTEAYAKDSEAQQVLNDLISIGGKNMGAFKRASEAAATAREKVFSTDAVKGVTEALVKFQATQQMSLDTVNKGSSEYKLVSDNIAAVDEIMAKLAAGGSVEAARDAFEKLTMSAQSTQSAFDGSIETVRKIEAEFAKAAQVTGAFATDIKLMNEVTNALTKETTPEVITQYANAFKEYGIAIDEALLNKGKDAVFTAEELAAIEAAKKSFEDLTKRFEDYNTATKMQPIIQAGIAESARQQALAGQKSLALETEMLSLKVETKNAQEGLALAQVKGVGVEEAIVRLLKAETAELLKQEQIRKQMVSDTTRTMGGDVGAVTDTVSMLERDKSKLTGFNPESIQTMNQAMQPMMDNLAKLGPDGELMSTLMQSAFNMGEVFSEAFSKIGEGGLEMTDGLQMAASVVSALGAVQSAQGKAAVAAIDKQIEAEKKRDGKSKESMAKIAALEKKKEQQERKNFEREKKVKMASAVISTALGMTRALELGPILGPVMAGVIAAMGAAQISMIASQSFDGGGAGTPSAPSKISVGNRQNTVDLAKSKSPAGELSYMRGDRGIGGMTNFTPAFTGAKYRAAGGNTAFMVGEQGPELFVPERPGTIVPADETAGGMGAPVNVSFNINTVDNRGVEDLLTNQRGYIIGMIREAANAHGETFLEQVDERAYEMEK